MNEEFWRWYVYGHWVCLTQWVGFIMVEYAYLGKGKSTRWCGPAL